MRREDGGDQLGRRSEMLTRTSSSFDVCVTCVYVRVSCWWCTGFSSLASFCIICCWQQRSAVSEDLLLFPAHDVCNRSSPSPSLLLPPSSHFFQPQHVSQSQLVLTFILIIKIAHAFAGYSLTTHRCDLMWCDVPLIESVVRFNMCFMYHIYPQSSCISYRGVS